jgi:hypothetical protein
MWVPDCAHQICIDQVRPFFILFLAQIFLQYCVFTVVICQGVGSSGRVVWGVGLYRLVAVIVGSDPA